jgi:hypothetical protein
MTTRHPGGRTCAELLLYTAIGLITVVVFVLTN